MEHAAETSYATTGKTELSATVQRNEGRVRTDDILHLVRHDPMKYKRAVGLLSKSKHLKKAKDSVDQDTEKRLLSDT